MDITKKIRAENVRYLITEKCSGNKSDFARRIGSSIQHVSKILRALDPDADQLKETAKKYVGDDIASRIENAFGLEKGQLSTRNLEETKNNQTSATSVPLVNWEDIESFLNNESVSMRLISVPEGLSNNSFVTRLPPDAGCSIKGLALPGDIIGVDLEANLANIVNNNYILAKISGSDDISCWKVKKIGLELLLQNEEFPERMHEGEWKLVGLIKFSIRGV
ncbi:hypothetical protein [Moellerella wisconsensis]|uniref:hypothetical protein n=1 Tax=Moellerella wisconsensis TaxID=158849 RepID=UPI001F4DE3F6|nr:hypothetical protein [Moellerella wisconsensis]UNH23131.1 hypothetical protein MNY68_09735 [Moellerella wisconsensis]